MEASIRQTAVYLVSRLEALPADRSRLLVGIAGTPGSGKSEFGLALCAVVNRLLHDRKQGQEIAAEEEEVVLIGMDGWHYSRAELDTFPDPVDAHARRGAHDTFDAVMFVDFVRSLRISASIPMTADTLHSSSTHHIPMAPSQYHHRTPVLSAPTFSHTLKDPLPNTLHIFSHHRMVLLEGLYVALDLEPWRATAQMLDEIILIEVDEETAKKRIVKRHMKAGLVTTEDEGLKRAVENDLPNGRYLLSKLLPPSIRVRSVDDPALVTQ